MATAKQIAARAKFAAMAKSGALAKKRKAAAKKTAPKRSKNPIAPVKAEKPTRFANPSERLPFKVYKATTSGHKTGDIIGAFRTRGVAESFGHAYANMHNCSVIVLGD